MMPVRVLMTEALMLILIGYCLGVYVMGGRWRACVILSAIALVLFFLVA